MLGVTAVFLDDSVDTILLGVQLERGMPDADHHDLPYARGGEAPVENLRFVCRAHNARAERDYGRTFMRADERKCAVRSMISRRSESKFDPRGTQGWDEDGRE
jgi:hypothetical protein